MAGICVIHSFIEKLAHWMYRDIKWHITCRVSCHIIIVNWMQLKQPICWECGATVHCFWLQPLCSLCISFTLSWMFVLKSSCYHPIHLLHKHGWKSEFSFCFPNLRLYLYPHALFVLFLYRFRRHLPKSWCNIHHGKHWLQHWFMVSWTCCEGCLWFFLTWTVESMKVQQI